MAEDTSKQPNKRQKKLAGSSDGQGLTGGPYPFHPEDVCIQQVGISLNCLFDGLMRVCLVCDIFTGLSFLESRDSGERFIRIGYRRTDDARDC